MTKFEYQFAPAVCSGLLAPSKTGQFLELQNQCIDIYVSLGVFCDPQDNIVSAKYELPPKYMKSIYFAISKQQTQSNHKQTKQIHTKDNTINLVSSNMIENLSKGVWPIVLLEQICSFIDGQSILANFCQRCKH